MLHSIIKDEDIGYANKALHSPLERVGARGIVLNGDKIAIFYKKNKNEYKLPGGGVEQKENLLDAFKREVLEETGCKVEIIKKLGITEEFKGHSNFHQISHVFIANVIENTHNLELTDKEIAEGGQLIWTTIDEAIRIIKDCFNNLKSSTYDKTGDVYSTKFIIKRDLSILEYYRLCENKVDLK